MFNPSQTMQRWKQDQEEEQKDKAEQLPEASETI